MESISLLAGWPLWILWVGGRVISSCLGSVGRRLALRFDVRWSGVPARMFCVYGVRCAVTTSVFDCGWALMGLRGLVFCVRVGVVCRGIPVGAGIHVMSIWLTVIMSQRL